MQLKIQNPDDKTKFMYMVTNQTVDDVDYNHSHQRTYSCIEAYTVNAYHEANSVSQKHLSPVLIFDEDGYYRETAWKFHTDNDKIKTIDNLEAFEVVCKKLQTDHDLPDNEIDLLIDIFSDFLLLTEFVSDLENLKEWLNKAETSRKAVTDRFGGVAKDEC